MRRGGVLSFVCYLIYLLGGLGLALYSYISAQNAEGWDGLGYALLMVLGLIGGAVGLVSVILKLIHMGTGLGFFGFLCMLIDIAVIALIVCSIIDGGGVSDPGNYILIAPIIALSSVSLISNLTSLGG